MLSVCVHVHLCVRVSRVYALVHLWALVCLHVCCSSCVCVQYVWAPVREQWWISLHWCLCTQCVSACVVCIQVHALSMCGLYAVCLHPAKGLRTPVPSEKDRGSSALRCPCSDPQGRTWAPGGSSGTKAETLNVNLTATHQGPHLSPTCYQLRTRSLERKARLAPVLCPCRGGAGFLCPGRLWAHLFHTTRCLLWDRPLPGASTHTFSTTAPSETGVIAHFLEEETEAQRVTGLVRAGFSLPPALRGLPSATTAPRNGSGLWRLPEGMASGAHSFLFCKPG